MKKKKIWLCVCLLFLAVFLREQPSDLFASSTTTLIEDFEDLSDWNGLKRELSRVKQGSQSGKWSNHIDQRSIRKNFAQPIEINELDHLQFWVFSEQATNEHIILRFYSDNEETSGADYFHDELVVDWQGWRFFSIPTTDFRYQRSPTGWQSINAVMFSLSDIVQPDLATVLIFDEMLFREPVVQNTKLQTQYSGDDLIYQYQLDLSPEVGLTYNVDFEMAPGVELLMHKSSADDSRITVSIKVSPDADISSPMSIPIYFEDNEGIVDAAYLTVSSPLSRRDHPKLFLDQTDLQKIKALTLNEPWAMAAQNRLVERAADWPNQFKKRYQLPNDWSLELPPGGGWLHNFSCVNGTPPVFNGLGETFSCPNSEKLHSDQVYEASIYRYMHQDLAEAALDSALAFRLTGNTDYGEKAADILLAYADAYHAYPFHDINGDATAGGGRIMATTLSESVWVIPISWSYDLIADSDILSLEEELKIQQDLLGEVAETIQRNPRHQSNWQTWHNAALGAIGVTTNNANLTHFAFSNATNGFEYHMNESVNSDGLWYEASWGYHFYSLTALHYSAEMADKAGLDVYRSNRLKSLFEVPVQLAPQNGWLPPFNDSPNNLQLKHYARLFESAYRLYGDDLFLRGVDLDNRGEDGLIWGRSAVDLEEASPVQSEIFEASGYAVLRSDSHNRFVALDFGEHGGGHGHFDKLSMVVDFGDIQMGVDPGTQHYSVPSHTTWDKMTVAHNTVVINEENQQAASGELTYQALGDSDALIQVETLDAYPNISLKRGIFSSTDYFLDFFSVQSLNGLHRQIDWIYHNNGQFSTDLPFLSGYELPSDYGYEHLSQVEAVDVQDSWRGLFTVDDKRIGTVRAAIGGGRGAFYQSSKSALAGESAGRILYDYVENDGSVDFVIPDLNFEISSDARLSFSILGDSSMHELSVFFQLNDRDLEYRLGQINWDDWKEFDIEVSSFEDIDLTSASVSAFGIRMNQLGGGRKGAIFIDEIQVSKAAEILYKQDFEAESAGMHIWAAGLEDSEVVSGVGLGSDLSVPVPFVMVRRNTNQTDFITLFEPFTQTPSIGSFRAEKIQDQMFGAEILGESFTDTLLVDFADPMIGYSKTFEEMMCDGALCRVRRDSGGALTRFSLFDGALIKFDDRQIVKISPAIAQLEVEYLAENAVHLACRSCNFIDRDVELIGENIESVLLNGQPVEFTSDIGQIIIEIKATPLDIRLDQIESIQARGRSLDNIQTIWLLLIFLIVFTVWMIRITRSD